MAAVIKGRGFVWSTGGLTFTVGIVSATNAAFFESFSFKRTASNYKLKDDNAATIGEAFFDPMAQFSCDVVPVSLSGTNTIANAQTSVDAYVPAPGTALTLVDASGTSLDGAQSGKFVVDDAEITGAKESPRMVKLTMHMSYDNDLSATIS